MYSVITQNGNDADYLTRLLVDTEADLDTTPKRKISPGSTAYVIETKKEYMLNNNNEWFEYATNSSSGGSDVIGGVITPMGTVATVDDLPVAGNRTWDFYMVGPKEDGSYDEYYYSALGNWEPMGSTIPDLDDVIKKDVLYAGDNNLGTIENPDIGTILAYVYGKISDDAAAAVESLEFVRGATAATVDQISVMMDATTIQTFFSPSVSLNALTSAIVADGQDYFTDLGVQPTSIDGSNWSHGNDFSSIDEEHGPYLILITKTASGTTEYHIKVLNSLKSAASEQKVNELENAINALEESSTLEII